MSLTTYCFLASALCLSTAIAQVVVQGSDQDANPGAVHVAEPTQAPIADVKVFDIPFGSYGAGPNSDESSNDFNDETGSNEKVQTQPGMVRNVIRKKKLKWPKAVVPYEIDSNKYRKSDISMIKAAIEEFHKHTCVRFVKRHPNIQNYVKITAKGSGCSTFVGRRKLYEHKVTLETPSCMKKGTVMHELMHSLGIYHEHMRPDRDKFIQINWANIAKDNHNNFVTLKNEEAQVFNLTYDYSSLMHYSPYAFAVNKTIPSMIPISIPSVRSAPIVKIGQRIRFSDTDIKKINYLYECHKNKKWKRKNYQ